MHVPSSVTGRHLFQVSGQASGQVGNPEEAGKKEERTPMMHLYCIERPDEDLAEVEAAYFEREGDEWVFYIHQAEVFRIPIASVVGISKT